MGGFWGPVPKRSLAIDPPTFLQDASHPTYQIFWTETGDPDRSFPEPILFSDWIEGDGAFYCISSCRIMRRYCNLLQPETARQILESFRYVDGLEPPSDGDTGDTLRYSQEATSVG